MDTTKQADWGGAKTAAEASANAFKKYNGISIENLTGPNNNLKLPETPIVPTYGGLPGATETIVNSANKEALKTKSDTSRDDYMKGIEDSGKISSSVDYSEVDRAKKEKDRLTAELLQEQTANRRAIEDLQKNNPGGTFGGALSDNIAEINRKSLSKQADISLLKFVADNDYEGAKSIADRQVAMKMEQSNAKLASLELFYKDNKDNFTKAEDREYSEKIEKERDEVQKQNEIEEQIKEIKLTAAQNGAPSSVIASLSKIDTTKPGAFDSALAIARSYIPKPISKPTTKVAIEDAFTNFIKTGTAPSGEKIGNGQGADGYADPSVYIRAFQEWTGSTKEFLNKFPIKNYINPLSYNLLPEALRLETTKKSSTTTNNREI